MLLFGQLQTQKVAVKKEVLQLPDVTGSYVCAWCVVGSYICVIVCRGRSDPLVQLCGCIPTFPICHDPRFTTASRRWLGDSVEILRWKAEQRKKKKTELARGEFSFLFLDTNSVHGSPSYTPHTHADATARPARHTRQHTPRPTNKAHTHIRSKMPPFLYSHKHTSNPQTLPTHKIPSSISRS